MSETTPPVPRLIEVQYPPMEPVYTVPMRRQRYWLHILLFLLTVFTTLMVGTQLERNFQHGLPIFTLGDGLIPLFPIKFVMQQPSRLLMGIPFSFTLLTILLAHEMGHFIYCLRYNVYATLPFFIPAPTLIGTMGAFIRIKSPIRSRTALFDIGIAGPMAGFVVAFFVMLLALMMSKPMPPGVGQGDIVLGFPLIFRFAYWLIMGGGMPGMSLESTLLHPTAVAAWVGMFATALNLLPGGQLDGGHIVYAIFPRLHRHVSRLTVGALLPMGLFWPGWWVWALLLTISGMRHPNVAPWPKPSYQRRLLAVVALVMLVITVTPVPFPGAAFQLPHWK
jgi:membrane-associated protease RseP (regulator of RpoE activity)